MGEQIKKRPSSMLSKEACEKKNLKTIPTNVSSCHSSNQLPLHCFGRHRWWDHLHWWWAKGPGACRCLGRPQACVSNTAPAQGFPCWLDPSRQWFPPSGRAAELPRSCCVPGGPESGPWPERGAVSPAGLRQEG